VDKWVIVASDTTVWIFDFEREDTGMDKPVKEIQTLITRRG
jgi:hypothetical protein